MSRSLKIALADDEAEVRQYFANALVSRGHRILVSASNGRELVDRCQVVRPQLLITDIRMDGLTGIQAMHELSQQGPLPTILISAHYKPDELDGKLDGQVIAFLQKPVKLADLHRAVDLAAKEIATCD